MAAAMTQIGQNTQMDITIGATQLQWFASVVRNGKGMQLQSPQIDGLTVTCHLKLIGRQIPLVQITGQSRALAHPNGSPGFLGKRTRVTHVVGVFMGDEDRINVLQIQIGSLQALAKFAQAQAAIDQQARHLSAALRFNQGRVTRAATAQVFEPQHRLTAVR